MFFSILTTLVLGSLIGIITSISVYGFISLVKFLTNVFRDPERSFNSFNDILTNTPEFVIFIFVMPFLVGLIVGCIRKYASDSRWHGPPDVILAAHSENNPLDIKSGFLTSFSSILSISAGGSVGQYGPLVHFGATIGAEINDLFRNKASYEILIGAGVASAARPASSSSALISALSNSNSSRLRSMKLCVRRDFSRMPLGVKR